jgi:hypothetical protein
MSNCILLATRWHVIPQAIHPLPATVSRGVNTPISRQRTTAAAAIFPDPHIRMRNY